MPFKMGSYLCQLHDTALGKGGGVSTNIPYQGRKKGFTKGPGLLSGHRERNGEVGGGTRGKTRLSLNSSLNAKMRS